METMIAYLGEFSVGEADIISIVALLEVQVLDIVSIGQVSKDTLHASEFVLESIHSPHPT